ncbi:hypothetical protein [Thalassobacillus hwangdonensis]|uniref:Uncharacterized protein n=1 Tax=Thalassobacillus hwangdonensis TaxID=546108 RepID=A0ABW3L1N4_9BACI
MSSNDGDEFNFHKLPKFRMDEDQKRANLYKVKRKHSSNTSIIRTQKWLAYPVTAVLFLLFIIAGYIRSTSVQMEQPESPLVSQKDLLLLEEYFDGVTPIIDPPFNGVYESFDKAVAAGLLYQAATFITEDDRIDTQTGEEFIEYKFSRGPLSKERFLQLHDEKEIQMKTPWVFLGAMEQHVEDERLKDVINNITQRTTEYTYDDLENDYEVYKDVYQSITAMYLRVREVTDSVTILEGEGGSWSARLQEIDEQQSYLDLDYKSSLESGENGVGAGTITIEWGGETIKEKFNPEWIGQSFPHLPISIKPEEREELSVKIKWEDGEETVTLLPVTY